MVASGPPRSEFHHYVTSWEPYARPHSFDHALESAYYVSGIVVGSGARPVSIYRIGA